MNLDMHGCYIIPMITSFFHDDQILFERHEISSGTLHFSNLLTVVLMEIKLGTNAYDIVCMTTTYCLNSCKWPQAFTSSLLKLANCSAHWDGIWYACILHHFNKGSRYFSLLLIVRGGLPPFTEIYVVVYKNEWRQVNLKYCEFEKEACSNGIKRKGDKIGMGYMKDG